MVLSLSTCGHRHACRQAYAYGMWSSRKTEAKTQYKMTLPASIGKGRDGNEVVADIHAWPHLVIAGIVGSGKTVLLHNILTSLISGNDPGWLRLILIDPKQVELDAYNGLAHLLTPVISDQRKTVKAFNWLIKEIERRYGVLKAEGLRDIDAYHVRVRNLIEQSNLDSEKEAMPFIVVAVDELSEAMVSYPREIEGSIIRITQLGGQVGVHLVVGTSNTRVLNNSVKMNIPTRIAFQVISESDSRSIIGSGSAEELHGTRGSVVHDARNEETYAYFDFRYAGQGIEPDDFGV
jgi:DNA segregation ATPase FtsK/SpoIIIE, S-DNA-T family